MNNIEYVSLSRQKDSRVDYIVLWIHRENSCSHYSTTDYSSLRLERMEYIFNSFMESK